MPKPSRGGDGKPRVCPENVADGRVAFRGGPALLFFIGRWKMVSVSFKLGIIGREKAYLGATNSDLECQFPELFRNYKPLLVLKTK
jgi:hypothetical protein